MATSQQTILQLEQIREAGRNEHEESIVTIQDTAQSGSSVPATGHKGNPIEITAPTRPVTRPPVYPVWPTSQPGPIAVAPPPGQHPHPRRSDQMVYEYYDQERGMPGVPPPSILAVRQHRDKTYLPDASFQDIVSETEAQQRWLDDGGSSNKEATPEIVSLKG